MEGSSSKQGMTRKALVHDVPRGVSHGVSGGSGWTGCASAGNSGVACGTGPVSTQQSAQGAWSAGKSDGIPSRSTEPSCGSTWIPQIAACFSIFTDGNASKSVGNRGVLMNTAGLLFGCPPATYDTRENPISTRANPPEFPRNPADTLAIRTDRLRFQQEIAPFRRTKKKIRREPLGQNRGVSGIQTPVDRAQACSSKHPDGYREVPF